MLLCSVLIVPVLNHILKVQQAFTHSPHSIRLCHYQRFGFIERSLQTKQILQTLLPEAPLAEVFKYETSVPYIFSCHSDVQQSSLTSKIIFWNIIIYVRRTGNAFIRVVRLSFSDLIYLDVTELDFQTFCTSLFEKMLQIFSILLYSFSISMTLEKKNTSMFPFLTEKACIAHGKQKNSSSPPKRDHPPTDNLHMIDSLPAEVPLNTVLCSCLFIYYCYYYSLDRILTSLKPPAQCPVISAGSGFHVPCV